MKIQSTLYLLFIVSTFQFAAQTPDQVNAIKGFCECVNSQNIVAESTKDVMIRAYENDSLIGEELNKHYEKNPQLIMKDSVAFEKISQAIESCEIKFSISKIEEQIDAFEVMEKQAACKFLMALITLGNDDEYEYEEDEEYIYEEE